MCSTELAETCAQTDDFVVLLLILRFQALLLQGQPYIIIKKVCMMVCNCLFVCDGGNTILYHKGLQTREARPIPYNIELCPGEIL